MKTYNRIVLASRPRGEPSADNFRLEALAVPALLPGQLLVRNHYLSLDPYMRGRMSEAKSYAASQALDETMIGGTAGEVVASQHPDYSVGDFVVANGGWAEMTVSDGTGVRKVDASRIPLSAYLGAVGMPGMTAWYGVNRILQLKAGQTLCVSAASGAVGSAVGQLAKLQGVRAVGIAGGRDKCDYVVNELGFDACVDYKAGNLFRDLQAAAPDGIDGIFENVAGEVFDAALAQTHWSAPAHDRRLQRRGHSAAQRARAAEEPRDAAGLHRHRAPRLLAAGPGRTGRAGGRRPAEIPRDGGAGPGRGTRSIPRPPERPQPWQATGKTDLNDTVPTLTIRYGDWATLGTAAQTIRLAVFVQEQNVPAELEMDDNDAVCLHAVAYDAAGTPVGTGRLLPDGHIGRMAVSKNARGTGIGSALLRGLMGQAKDRGHAQVILSAQTHAAPFYLAHGFTQVGDEFFEAGIAHVAMHHAF
jgi:NADPH-dependent curcumin reductase CurA/predicted GNAT family N-acyltransferase